MSLLGWPCNFYSSFCFEYSWPFCFLFGSSLWLDYGCMMSSFFSISLVYLPFYWYLYVFIYCNSSYSCVYLLSFLCATIFANFAWIQFDNGNNIFAVKLNMIWLCFIVNFCIYVHQGDLSKVFSLLCPSGFDNQIMLALGSEVGRILPLE